MDPFVQTLKKVSSYSLPIPFIGEKKHKKLVFTIPVLAFRCFTTTAIAPASPNRGAILAKHECSYGIPVKTILAVFTVFSIVHPQGFISIVMITCML